MKIFFSPSLISFYPEDINYNSLPDDLVEITESQWQELINGQSNGKVIGSDKNGKPLLLERPELTKDEQIVIAQGEKGQRLNLATGNIAPLQDAVDLGIATDEEEASLKAWKTYRVMVSRADLSYAPDVKWPSEPKANKGGSS